MKNLVFLFFVLTLAIAGCSGSQSGNNDLSLMISNGHAEAWINVMPGSDATFFVTGSMDIKNYGDSTVNSISIMKCLVTQNKEIVYDLIPELKDSLGASLSLGTGQTGNGVFTSKGVELKNEFNPDKPVDLTIFLISSKTLFAVSSRLKIINNIGTEKKSAMCHIHFN